MCIHIYVCCAKSCQLCPTLCGPVACSPLSSSVHGILQAGILEWVAISSSRESSQPRDWTRVSYVSCIGRQVFYDYCRLSAVQSLSRVRLCNHMNCSKQASVSITNSWSSARIMSIESVMPSSHLILCLPLLLPLQSLTASESFLMSQIFTWGGQNIGVSV